MTAIGKVPLVGLAVAVALAVLPTAALATEVEFNKATEDNTHFTVSGGEAVMILWGVENVICEKTTGTGEFALEGGTTKSKTGTINLTLTKCTTQLFGFNCTTTGQPTGTIQTQNLTFHLVAIEKGKPGILLTPNDNTGQFAKFTCFSINVTIVGNGIIGHITAPACDKNSASMTIVFNKMGEEEEEEQSPLTIDEDEETEYTSEAVVGEEEAGKSIFINESTSTLTQGEALLTC